MKLQPTHQTLLEYLDKHGPVNTFRLSRELGIDRVQLINIVKGLTKKGLTEFKSGVVTKIKSKLQEEQKIAESKETTPTVSEHAQKPKVFDTPKKPNIQKQGYSKLKKVKREIQKERKEREIFLRQREEAVKKREEAVSAEQRKFDGDKALLEKEREGIIQKIVEAIGLGKEKEKIAIARKKLREEKKQISKAKTLKEDINKLEATLEDVKRKVSIEKSKLKRLKEKAVKPMIVAKMSEIRRISKHAQKPKVFDKTKKSKEKRIKPPSKPKIEKPLEKIGVSKPETEQSEIMPKELWQSATKIPEEKTEDKFHALIEQEINLLKQKRINEARNTHLQIKDMISGVIDPDQRKIIIRDWNRIKDVY